MNTATELANGLRTLISACEDGDHDAAIAAVCKAITAAGLTVDIVTSDDSPDDLNGDGDTLWVVSTHTLTIDGDAVAEWTRCSMGTWGEVGRQCSDDEWCISEDTNGGDGLPDAVAVALDALGVEDELPPDVPGPALATDEYEPDSAGGYAVYWETVGDDDHVVARYATQEAALAVCAQRNREFAARNPSGGGTTYLCCYGVRVLDAGKWVLVD